MGLVLNDAHTQWANRPADERFWDLPSLHAAMVRFKQDAKVIPVSTKDLRVAAVGDKGLALVQQRGDTQATAAFTFGSFGQLCGLTGVPAGLLREQPNRLAAQNLNWGLANRDTEDKATRGLVDTRLNTIRGFSSDTYGRIWNSDITERLLPLMSQGWRGAPARPTGSDDTMGRKATAADVLANVMPGLGIKEGDMIAPAGFYGNADNMFVFMVNEQKTVKAGNVELCRGFFITNAETPGTAEKITTFLYGGVCGNHYVWDAQQVIRSKVVHKGSQAANRAWRNLYSEIATYANASASAMEERIKVAQNLELGKTQDEVVDMLFEKKVEGKAVLKEAYLTAQRFVGVDGHNSPRTVWGMMGGMTRLSQQTKFADKRVKLDQAASKILALVPKTVAFN